MADKTKPEGLKRARQAGDDDVEGHRVTAREGFHATKREGIDAKPEGLKRARQAGDDDVEGHRLTAREGFRATKREGFRATKREGAVEEEDVEGHSMLPNAGLSRPLAQARERDIQQHLRRHDFEADARAAKKDRR